MVTLELLFKGGAFMSPQVEYTKEFLESLVEDAFLNKKIVKINEVYVNFWELQFAKVVEIKKEYATEIPPGDLK